MWGCPPLLLVARRGRELLGLQGEVQASRPGRRTRVTWSCPPLLPPTTPAPPFSRLCPPPPRLCVMLTLTGAHLTEISLCARPWLDRHRSARLVAAPPRNRALSLFHRGGKQDSEK